MYLPCCRNALAFGENSSGKANPFIGIGDFALSHTTDHTGGDSSWAMFLFHWAFSAAAATIMAGAIAERMTMQVYMGYTCLMTTLVRPPATTPGRPAAGRGLKAQSLPSPASANDMTGPPLGLSSACKGCLFWPLARVKHDRLKGVAGICWVIGAVFQPSHQVVT